MDAPNASQQAAEPVRLSEPAPLAPPESNGRSTRLLLIWLLILAVGVGFRLWLVRNTLLGDPFDLSLFMKWTRKLGELGIAGFYEQEKFCDYTPFSVLIMHAMGRLGAAFDLLAVRETLAPLVKAPALIADLFIGIALLLEGRRRIGLAGGVAASSVYLLNPVSLYDGAYWGQVDAIHTAFLLFALVFVGRSRWASAGAASALALLTKFQSIAILPLVIFEVYRLGAWRGLLKALAAGVLVIVVVLAPFAASNQLAEVIGRSYVRVVGQYDDLAKGAFNIWHVVADSPRGTDTAVPGVVMAAAANGRPSAPASSAWLAGLSFRRISVIAYTLVVASILSLYSLRPGPVSRYGAGGALAIAFFLVPTEMHERYAFPAIALLAIWAASAARRERVYWLFSMLLMLNLAAVLSPGAVAPQIGMGITLALVTVCGALPFSTPVRRPVADPAETPIKADWTAPFIPAFRWATATAIAVSVGGASYVVYLGIRAPSPHADDRVTYLSALTPIESHQDWRKLGRDRSAAGSPLRIGSTIYFVGLGTHANSRHVYEIPPGAVRFEAEVGPGAAAGGKGTPVAAVELDDVRVFSTELLTEANSPVRISVPLSGQARIALITEGGGDGIRSDHLDWGLARFEFGDSDAVPADAQVP